MRGRVGSSGLTLMEVLVALTILSLLGSVLWQSLAQMARVERLIAGDALREPTDMLHMQWVRRLLEAAMPAGQAETDSFRGEQDRVEGFSTDVPMWPANTAAAFSLRLGHDSESGLYTLDLQIGSATSFVPQAKPVRLLGWQGGPGQFEYMADDGTWHGRWPVQTLGSQDRTLPRMVALRTGSPDGALALIQIRHSGQPPLSRRSLE